MAVHSSVGKCYLFVLALVVFDSSQGEYTNESLFTIFYSACFSTVLASAYQVVHPSEYAYKSNSVTRSEESNANCRMYPPNSEDGGIHYTHCDGSQLKLTDSDLGSKQYSSSDYYVWNDTSSIGRLLFIFPTRVNLTTITLHYYSDNARGLTRLRFWSVPDDFEVWDAPTASYSYVNIDAVPPGGEPAGRRNVSVNVNVITKRILMYKFSSSFIFAVSEVEFFLCNSSKFASVDLGDLCCVHVYFIFIFIFKSEASTTTGTPDTPTTTILQQTPTTTPGNASDTTSTATTQMLTTRGQ